MEPTGQGFGSDPSSSKRKNSWAGGHSETGPNGTQS